MAAIVATECAPSSAMHARVDTNIIDESTASSTGDAALSPLNRAQTVACVSVCAAAVGPEQWRGRARAVLQGHGGFPKPSGHPALLRAISCDDLLHAAAEIE